MANNRPLCAYIIHVYPDLIHHIKLACQISKASPPPSTNFYLIQNLNSWCCVFTITVDYILPDCKALHAIYNATSIGENILPVNYQVLQQCPELLVTYFTRNLVSNVNYVIR